MGGFGNPFPPNPPVGGFMRPNEFLGQLVDSCRRHARLVLVVAVALAAGAGWLAWSQLRLMTDVDQLFSSKLAWRQSAAAFDRQFPQFRDLLVVIIDGGSPEVMDATAADLASALSGDTQHFSSVRRPDALPFFAKEGLLLLDTDQLGRVLDQTIDAQPFLGQLAADPSARGLFAALSLLAVGVQRGQANLDASLPALRAFHTSIADALAGHPHPLSWQRLIASGTADLGSPFRVVLAQVRLDFNSLQPGGAATEAIRAAAARLPFVTGGEARVRITGAVALADEEFATVAQGALVGTIASALLVTLWLVIAVRSWRLVVAIVGTLAFGLVMTTGFATIAVGSLNLISVAFAILFVGIAVDFAIQFTVRYRGVRHGTPSFEAALAATARGCGGQILLAAVTAAAGFLAFVPTDFSGVAELGLIAGVGMLIAFVCTMTFLPALMTILRPGSEGAEIGFAAGRYADGALYRHRRAVLAVFGAIAVLSAALLPGLSFDFDPLHTKNPDTEAMRTLQELLNEPLSNPYSVDVLAPNVQAAADLAEKMARLPLAGQVLTLTTFVPKDQKAKLALVADAADILGPTLAPRAAAAPVTAGDIRLAAVAAGAQIASAAAKLSPDHPLLAIGADLAAVAKAPDAAVLAVNRALTQFLPTELDALRTALTAEPITAETLPQDLARDWRLPDGRVRVSVLAKPESHDARGLAAFVAEARSVAPDVAGTAVTIVETGATVIGAFRSAALGALAAIAAILAIALRRPLDVAAVLAPLLMSALMTGLFAVVLPLPLNFANVIALPLLLGVGVSFNVYFVMNWRAGRRSFLGSPTARAILFSTLTTGTAFGSLALSMHPGTASMGELLLLSLGCTLLVTFIFVPALLGVLPARSQVSTHDESVG